MGYLGRVKPLESIGNVVRSTYTGDASTTTYNLPVAVANEESIIVTINGVTQQDAAYSTNGTQLIFASAPALNDSIEIRCISGVGQGYTPPDGSVTTAKLNSQAVTADKLHNTLDLSGKTVTLPSGTGGKILQVASTTTDGILSTTTQGSPSTITNGVEVFSISFTPQRSNSILLAQTSSISIHEQANFGDIPWLALWDGSTFISANSGTWIYSVFSGPGYNGAYRTLNESWTLTNSNTRTISVRAGINAGSGTTYINGNTYSNYTGSSARVSLTVWEIAG